MNFKIKLNFLKKISINLLLSIIVKIIFCTNSNAAIFEVEAKGIYGGFWRDLYKFGPVVIDTIGSDLGVFAKRNFKIGFSFTTLVGILSGNNNDNVFDALSGSDGNPDRYSGVLSALEPSDFSYSTAALKFEYIIMDGETFGFSSTTNFGQGVYAQGKIQNESNNEEEYKSFGHFYGSLGFGLILKLTKNLKLSIGFSHRKDFDSFDNNRPDGFEVLEGISIFNHLYLSKF